jgi:tyrosine-protein phosphatase
VAKEVSLPFEDEPHFPFEPDVKGAERSILPGNGVGGRFPANPATARPELLYLHLPWSHGQNDLVQKGFVDAMAFIDHCLKARTNVLIQ